MKLTLEDAKGLYVLCHGKRYYTQYDLFKHWASHKGNKGNKGKETK